MSTITNNGITANPTQSTFATRAWTAAKGIAYAGAATAALSEGVQYLFSASSPGSVSAGTTIGSNATTSAVWVAGVGLAGMALLDFIGPARADRTAAGIKTTLESAAEKTEEKVNDVKESLCAAAEKTGQTVRDGVEEIKDTAQTVKDTHVHVCTDKHCGGH